MENEKNLDLSLGLPCRGSSSSPKAKHGSSSENRSNKEDRDIKIINDFKTFLEGGNGTHHFAKVEENLPNKSGKAVMESETSKNSNTGGMWWANTDAEEEKRSSTSEKRKNLFTEANQLKKQERETNHHDSADKTKTSHISITTDEGSTADNEDVADSEMASSTLRQVHDNASHQFASSGGISKLQKDLYGGQSGVEFLGQRRFTIASDKEMMTKPFGVPYQGQPVNTKVGSNGEGPSMVPSNFPVMFGNSTVQLPMLDRDNSRGIIAHHQLVHLNQENGKNSGKQPHIGEDDPKAHNSVHQVKDSSPAASSQPRTESITADFPAIKPGIAADIKFGGCGSAPNLPWVSTTGSGPNGRTISGVTYRFSATQIRIVCACHGSHLSPEEFVRHASEENSTSADGLASFPGNPAASAHN